jgi:hypothetical protein
MKDFKFDATNEPIRRSKRFFAAAEAMFGPQNRTAAAEPKPAPSGPKTGAPR